MGAIDILEAGKGALSAEPDEDAFAAAVCRLLDSPALRRTLAAEGIAYAAEWDAAKQAARLENFYAEALLRHGPARVAVRAVAAAD
jgi:glycosyltransferase involved in cell wall biosynthesis